MLVALNGELKFIGRRTPNSRASPSAMSVYPEKSKYICKLTASIADHAEMKAGGAPDDAGSNVGVTSAESPSAMNTFLKRPIENKQMATGALSNRVRELN